MTANVYPLVLYNTLKVFLTISPGRREKVDVSRDFYTTIINRYNLRDASDEDWGKYQTILSNTDWATETQHFSASQKVDFLAKIMEEAVSKVFPLKSEKKKGYKIPNVVQKKMKRRTTLGKSMMTTREPKFFLKCQLELRSLEKEISAHHNEYTAKTESKMIDKMQDNPSLFYSYARSFSKDSGKIGPLINERDEIIADDLGVSELLRQQYESVFSDPCTNIDRDKLDDFIHSTEDDLAHGESTHDRLNFSLKDVEITTSAVSKAVKALSEKASPGPDGIPTLCYKMGGESVILWLVDILRQSIDTDDVPISMREAFISPNFKGGDRGRPASYRPIALTSHISKIMERVVRAQLVEYLESTGLLDSTQHGSRPGRSTLSQLIVQYDRKWRKCCILPVSYFGKAICINK